MTSPEPFAVAVERHGATLVVVPSGELDLSTAPQLARTIQAEDDYDLLVLDLRELEFMDSSGVRLLVAEQERAAQQRHELRIVRGSAEVERVLRVTRLDERLPLVEPDELDVPA
jgi:anti-sigma B factor antagonist